jgi:hypothetical protein
MTAGERPAPLPTETGPAEDRTVALPPSPIIESRDGNDNSAPAALAVFGRLLREEGMARASGGLDAWTRRCWQAGIGSHAATGRPFGADEVRELGGPEPTSSGVVGALFMACCRAGLIQPHGFVQFRRPFRHASRRRLWIGGQAA